VLRNILSRLPPQVANPALLIGNETSDDAAVFRISDDQAVVATTDFFMPIVDDARDFGRIAAANALSDVYAMGGRPILALAIAGMPLAKIAEETIGDILAGGAEMCAIAGVPVAGGHTIDAPEPLYGLAVVGLVHPERVKRNDAAAEGDVLILGKALGIGILGAAMNKDELDAEGYRQMVDTATRLNSVGADLAALAGVNAVTDITGFGLAGHLLEICRGSGLVAVIDFADLPVLPAALDYAQRGYNTGAAIRNRKSFGDEMTLADDLRDWQENLLVDPQTSGGLLVTCRAEIAAEVLRLFHDQGHVDAAIIGRMEGGAPRLVVR
jgi:selenide, water dikinase